MLSTVTPTYTRFMPRCTLGLTLYRWTRDCLDAGARNGRRALDYADLGCRGAWTPGGTVPITALARHRRFRTRGSIGSTFGTRPRTPLPVASGITPVPLASGSLCGLTDCSRRVPLNQTACEESAQRRCMHTPYRPIRTRPRESPSGGTQGYPMPSGPGHATAPRAKVSFEEIPLPEHPYQRVSLSPSRREQELRKAPSA